MSIKIESMEMPETCDDCPFHVYHSHYEYVCKATPLFYPMNLANSKGIRKDWCPLSEASEPCEDTISRQAAITAIQKAYADTEGGTDKCAVWKNVGLTNALHIMQDLPSAQPERKKGRWIRNDNGTYSCSVCQSWIPEEQHYYARYCLYCGTDMRSENNE